MIPTAKCCEIIAKWSDLGQSRLRSHPQHSAWPDLLARFGRSDP
ncbi:hypothetical protein RMSM_00864 [Rhodopirellula maiorica SM1]|uniref:Uncharacterized protein n=1 Tax=Rhodopirellula maiorica SM1 TaxID=1265738 RepID=M5RSL7_9BACT|nr:hypothetical protein RMSM_00864 [Rhodopirellula maiorica SM1]